MNRGSVQVSDWRTEEESGGDSSKKKKVTGISPDQFYSHKSNGNEMIHELRYNARRRVVEHDIARYFHESRLKRSAYRSVTDVHIFSLQEHAFLELDHLLNLYHNQYERGISVDNKKTFHSNELEANFNDDSSDMEDEPKRCRRRQNIGAKPYALPSRRSIENQQKENASPGSSTRKAQFVETFLRDHKRGVVTSCNGDDSNWLPALWSMEPRILSVEITSGRRRYVVGHFGRLVDYYWRKLDPTARHHYELIRENNPCRLYFDIESSRKFNEIATNEEALMTEFINELITEVKSVFDIQISRRSIVDLDSSTLDKFSRHLIVHMPKGELFANTRQVGIFVRQFISRLAEEQATGNLSRNRPILAKYLFVNTKREKDRTCFVDIGVYTRNRLFRILGSSKYGKPTSAVLRIAMANEYPFRNFHNGKFYSPEQRKNLEHSALGLNKSLQNTKESPSVDCIKTVTDWHDHAEALAATLVVPLNSSKINFPILRFLGDDCVEAPLSSSMQHRSKASPSHAKIGPSPYPCLDKYVREHLSTRGGEQVGKIRAWSLTSYKSPENANNQYFNNEQCNANVITYHMSHNRWCERICRAHKSNNIMWNIDLRHLTCWQTCHDPDCRAMGFKGNNVNLPEELRVEVSDAVFEQALIAQQEKLLQTQNDRNENSFDENRIIEVDDSFESALVEAAIRIERQGEIVDSYHSNVEHISNINVSDSSFEAALVRLQIEK